MPSALPTKLKQDAIVEALLELQFESDDVGEIVIGRLSDAAELNTFSINRLPPSNIPEPIRDNDPNLRFQPIVERRAPDELSTARIGSHVFSYHAYTPYPGWSAFEPRLVSIVETLFSKLSNVRVTRLGFRYINFLRSSLHAVNNLGEISLKIELKGNPLTENVNIGFLTLASDEHHVMTRLASPNFVESSSKPADMVAAIDVDVFTPHGFSVDNCNDAVEWVSKAHLFEKQAFFNLFTQKQISELREE